MLSCWGPNFSLRYQRGSRSAWAGGSCSILSIRSNIPLSPPALLYTTSRPSTFLFITHMDINKWTLYISHHVLDLYLGQGVDVPSGLTMTAFSRPNTRVFGYEVMQHSSDSPRSPTLCSSRVASWTCVRQETPTHTTHSLYVLCTRAHIVRVSNSYLSSQKSLR